MRNILIFLILAAAAYGDTVLHNASFGLPNIIDIDGMRFDIIGSSKSDVLRVMSNYSDTIINAGDCETADYYTFCFDGYFFDEEDLEVYADLTVYKFDCLSYLGENGSMLCKKHIGEVCLDDAECKSKCLHGICALVHEVCGDGFCDPGEKCSEDCGIVADNTILNDTHAAQNTTNESIDASGNNINLSNTTEITDKENTNKENASVEVAGNATAPNNTSLETSENGIDYQRAAPTVQDNHTASEAAGEAIQDNQTTYHTASETISGISPKRIVIIGCAVLIVALVVLIFAKKHEGIQ